MGIAATEGAASRLAIDGGPRAVTVPAGDRWESVTELERSYVSAALDDVESVYDQIELFEGEFREGVGSRHALAVCNGTAALHSAIFAAGSRGGAEVIVPSVTWHATITPILHCGATPVFCDVDPATFCADPQDVARKVTERTCAIVVTHVYGNPADMDAFRAIVRGTDITLIEDCSHAHGALWDGRPVGSLGHIGCFSLQNSKPVSGVEAGVITTSDDALYDRMVALGHYGRIDQLLATDTLRGLGGMGLGVKYRANPLAMALARSRLRRLPELNRRRARWFDRLDELLDPVEGFYPQEAYPKATRGGLLLYAVRAEPEDIDAPVEAIGAALIAEGVAVRAERPSGDYGAMHLQPLFNDFPLERLGGPWGDLPPDARRPLRAGSLPVSERLNRTCFWLTTPVDPDPEWVEQTAAGFAKVAAAGPRLRDLARASG